MFLLRRYSFRSRAHGATTVRCRLFQISHRVGLPRRPPTDEPVSWQPCHLWCRFSTGEPDLVTEVSLVDGGAYFPLVFAALMLAQYRACRRSPEAQRARSIVEDQRVRTHVVGAALAPERLEGVPGTRSPTRLDVDAVFVPYRLIMC